MESKVNRILRLIAVLLALLFLASCQPEVGSEEWCAELKAKPNGDWTLNEIQTYAKSCYLR